MAECYADYDESDCSSEEDEYSLPSNNHKKRKSQKISSQRLSVTIGTNFDSGNSDDDCKGDSPTVPYQYKVLLDSSSDETRAYFKDWTPSVPFQ